MILILTSSKPQFIPKERVSQGMKKGLWKLNIESEIRSLREVEVFIRTGKVRVLIAGKPLERYKMVYLRKASGFDNIAFILSRVAAQKRIFFIDDFRAETRSAGKLMDMFLLAQKNVSVPGTYHALEYSEKNIRNAISFLSLPIVAKATKFGGGRMVYLARSIKNLKKVLRRHSGKEFILQEYIRNDFDYRIVVLGKKAAVAEKRIRTRKKEFRNNACLGGKEVFMDMCDVPKKISALATRAATVMGVQVAGVDVIRSPQNRDYILEVNPAPGFSIDDDTSNELQETIKYLARCAKKIS